ncbi:hypothetical protein EZ027_14005 [Enterococcus casseliflavus]|uniref:Uncharacterized protein n=1 Tax=Enterococcus casseliflavus TaxID=37734 RepID=A0A6G2FLD2_ENTCA|nr:hypothetical protein [Enterococcus casseliflavus]
MIKILATDYIDSHKDEQGDVPILLNCGVKHKNRIIVLRVSVEFAKWIYLTSGTGAYYTSAIRTVDKQNVFGVTELYADHFPNMRIEQEEADES